ncbi:methyltransferase, partial [Candidatus Pacearchaeota archaeon]|nr:methyltransferase [Candidatus Pacearchaeota archaeon]
VLEAKDIPSLNENEIEMMENNGLNEQEKRRTREKELKIQADEKQKAFQEEMKAKTPTGTQSIIVAELVQDKSDLSSDYHGSISTRTIILAFSKHTRDLFPEMRMAALNHPETSFLHDADKKAEHREKYSMGAGFYLKQGWRDSNGWKISKVRPYQNNYSIGCDAEWSLPKTPEKSRTPTRKADNTGGIEEHHHTKKDIDIFIVLIPYDMERDDFNATRNRAKDVGGWYSRKWGNCPNGFAFTDKATAECFQQQGFGESTPNPQPLKDGGDKLREIGKKIQKDIDGAFADRRENTPKQQQQAANARQNGRHYQRTQKALFLLADLFDSGETPELLAGFSSKKSVLDAMRCDVDRSRCGYYDVPIELDKPSKETSENLALWELVGGTSEEDKKAEELKTKINGLKFAKIPGYFPTPPEVIQLMLDHAQLKEGMNILEPSAGSGSIVDAIRETNIDVGIVCFEVNHTLREILHTKKHSLVGDDFMKADSEDRVKWSFDRVIMNPPFERLQDIDHVKKAYSLLKPGGSLISIMSPGPFSNTQKKAVEFRGWFVEKLGEVHELPEGSFKSSGTGVASRLVIIDKEN